MDAADPPRGVLPAHHVAADPLGVPGGVDGPQDAQLLVAQRVGLEGDGRLHGHQAGQLEEVVLQDVAAGAGLLVELAAPLHAQVLRHGDLHVIDVAAVPHRLEDAVAEAEDQQVADGLLAQVVVDAVDLPLVEDVGDLAVERPRRGQVAPEGLLDDDADPAPAARAGQAGAPEVGDDVAVGAGMGGQVEEAVAAGAALRVERLQPCAEGGIGGLVGEVARLVEDAVGEVVPERLLHRHARELGHRRGHLRPVGVVGVRPPREGDHRLLGRQQARPGQVVEGRQDLAVRQVAGAAEDDHGARVGHLLQAQAGAQRVARAAGRPSAFRHGWPGAAWRSRSRRDGRRDEAGEGLQPGVRVGPQVDAQDGQLGAPRGRPGRRPPAPRSACRSSPAHRGWARHRRGRR